MTLMYSGDQTKRTLAHEVLNKANWGLGASEKVAVVTVGVSTMVHGGYFWRWLGRFPAGLDNLFFGKFFFVRMRFLRESAGRRVA